MSKMSRIEERKMLETVCRLLNAEKPMDFQQCIQFVDTLIQKDLLQIDPDNKDNILVYREAGMKSPEGWYSENILSIASELADDINDQQNMLKALRDKIDASILDITEQDIRIVDELIISDDAESIEATYEMWFDVDKYFGTNTRNDDSAWINFYTVYHQDGRITATYVVEFDDDSANYEWELTRFEQGFFKGLMQQYAVEKYRSTLQGMLKTAKAES